MTGQVKEDILCRFGELGVRVQDGKVSFRPTLLRDEEFLSDGTLSFSYCGAKVTYHRGQGDGMTLSAADSARLFARQMKDNASDIGGHLLPQYQQAYANYFVKYLEAYKAKGVDIWAVTPINEPLGNNNNWESMYFDPGYEAAFVRDLDELRNGLPRKESQFGAIYWWMVKMGQSLALVLGGAILKWVAFDQNAAVQTSETLTQLRLADIIVPAGSAFVAIFVMSGYNLTESKMAEIKAELKKRRG